MFVELCLKKNGQTFYTGRVRFRSLVGLLVQSSRSSTPSQILLDAPGCPVSCHLSISDILMFIYLIYVIMLVSKQNLLAFNACCTVDDEGLTFRWTVENNKKNS